jgi:hypothetical protein
MVSGEDGEWVSGASWVSGVLLLWVEVAASFRLYFTILMIMGFLLCYQAYVNVWFCTVLFVDT